MQQPSQPDQPISAESFPTDPTGLPEATRPQLQELADGDLLDLRIGAVAKRLGDATVRMLGYNGSIPGPTLKVRQGSEVIVHVTNDGDLEGTVHWHGLRLENKYDGVPHETQTPIPVGGEFTYRIRFPDPGLYWYHPHIREDYTQEMGLYGNILVVPAEEGYWPPAHRDVLLTLDDLLIEDGKIAPFSPAETTYTAMGRFGNVLLISGEQDHTLTARCQAFISWACHGSTPAARRCSASSATTPPTLPAASPPQRRLPTLLPGPRSTRRREPSRKASETGEKTSLAAGSCSVAVVWRTSRSMDQ